MASLGGVHRLDRMLTDWTLQALVLFALILSTQYVVLLRRSTPAGRGLLSLNIVCDMNALVVGMSDRKEIAAARRALGRYVLSPAGRTRNESLFIYAALLQMLDGALAGAPTDGRRLVVSDDARSACGPMSCKRGTSRRQR